MAAVRYYLSTSAAAAVSPARESHWTAANFALAGKAMDTAKSNSALAAEIPALTYGTGGTCDLAVAPGRMVLRQWVGPQIGVFDFTGSTVSLVLKTAASGSSLTMKLNMSVRLYHTDATLTTLLAANAADYDTTFPTTAATRIANAVALAAVVSQNNDRLVVEVGVNFSVLSATCRWPIMTDGDPSASADYALTTALTTNLDPWVEFSGTLPAPTIYNGQFLQFFH
jgi:hypothetical protein